jgi:hypothetical protein
MSLPDSTAGPLTVRDLLDRDPRPGVQRRALTGLSTPQLDALESRLTFALSCLTNEDQRAEIARLRASVGRVIANRTATDVYRLLLAEAV